MPGLMSISNAYSQLLCLPCGKKLAHGKVAEALKLQSSPWLGPPVEFREHAVCFYSAVFGIASAQ